jgi:hypothetical protein
LPGSTLAPRGATGGYIIAYAVTLASFIVIWFNHPILLYIGRDANLSLWLSKAYLDWAYPLDVTAMNPLQGMTSMLMATNPYFNPGAWIFQTALPEIPKQVISFIVYFVEVTASVFLLGVVLGFSRLFAFVGALWLAFLLFPPFNFVYGLQGWLATNPIYGHTLTLSNLLLVAFIRIGAESPTAPGFGRRLVRNWLLASCIVLLVLLIVLAAPFYNGGMLVGTFLLTGVILLSSQSVSQMLWRLAAGVYVLACCAALGFPGFFAGAQAYSARFSGAEGRLLQFHWPAEFSSELIAGARQGLCAWGVVCDRMAQWPLALTGSYWLQLSIIVGAIAVAIRMRPPLAHVGALFAVLWIALLVIWIGANLGIVSAFPLSPIYFFLMMYPFWAFFSLYAGVWLMEITLSRFVPQVRSADPRLVCAALCVAAVALIPLFHADVSRVFKWGGAQLAPATPITQALARDIALRPGEAYRGSVATLLGAPGSPLRRRLLDNDARPLQPGEFERFLQVLAMDTGNSHDLLDLWWRDIPTLSEYGQGLSKPLISFISNVLNAPADPHDLNFGLPRLANIDILRAMGVRFIITDLQLRANRARMTQVLPLSGGIALYLYELSDPNVAGFSPVKLSGPVSPAELLHRIGSDPALFESEAFVDSPTAQNLVPVERSQVVFERGAVHVTARSTGPSALLLPVQFSHCFRVAGQKPDGIKVLRANLLHTLVLFERELDIRLRWEFSFWRNRGCRLRDAEDVRALGLP